MLAMRNKSISFVFVTLLLWASVTYFFIFHQSIKMDKKQHKLASQILKLEKEMNELVSSNAKLLQQLNIKNIIRHDKYQNSSIKTSVFNKNNSAIKKLESIINYEEKKYNSMLWSNNSHNTTKWLDNAHVKINSKLVSRKNFENGLPVIAILVIACNRITVRRCLDQLIKYRPNTERFPIIVSQDCGHQQTADVIKSYGRKVIHIQQPDQSDIEVPPIEKKFKGYFKIARHYGWALNEIFFRFNHETAIVIEDDLDIAPDFFEYFLGTHFLLAADPSLWCISAWNDNGKSDLIDLNSPHLLYRTDFFPGLGWMLTRNLWLELSPKWPKSYWDDWIREPEQRKNRSCIRPELSRTRTFGKLGVSNGLFYEKHLQFIKLNQQLVPFTKMNLTYLLKEYYDLAFINEVYKSKVIAHVDLKTNKITSSGSIRIPYYTRQVYKSTAKMFGLMDDFKSGVPRTGYRGIVTFFYSGRRAYLAPTTSWSGYNTSWN